MTDQLPEFIPIEETPDNIYIDPPLYSDAVDKPYNPHHTTVTNLNLFHKKFRFFNILGRGIYQSRTGVKKGNVILRNLPKGYRFRRNKKGNCYITGHPSGLILSAVKILPHFIWLENKSTDGDCTCFGCISDVQPSPSSLISLPPQKPPRIITELSPLINGCTIDSFKQMSSVTIEAPQDFYLQLYTIPLPKIVKPKITLLSVKQEMSQLNINKK